MIASDNLPNMSGDWTKDKYEFMKIQELTSNSKVPTIDDLMDEDFYYDEEDGWVLGV